MARVRQYPKETVELCKQLYIKGWNLAEIAREMNVEAHTVRNWKNKHQWDDITSFQTVEMALSRRLNVLADRENKSEDEFKEMNLIIDKLAHYQIESAKASMIRKGIMPTVEPTDIVGLKTDGKPNAARKKSSKRRKKNDISEITEQQLLDLLDAQFFDYQKRWWQAKEDNATCRNRFILKSRQIGATYYFAFEAFADAVMTGDNQIFLSASRAQADVFKAYIIAFAEQFFDVPLKGQDVIKLSNGAELRFLSTNANTAQSYHGHLYRDEVFWIPNYDKLEKVSSGMAAHKKWRRTDFSTPSSLSHPAYAKWSGAKFNENRSEANQIQFDISHKTLKDGHLGVDKIWRHIVNVVDAERQGCTLFNIDELREEYSKDDFANLFMCQFIDDAKSLFSLGTMMTCYATHDYKDYSEKADRPYGNRPVALGYDPSRTRDNASLAILAIPIRTGGKEDKWRVLKTYDFHGQNFQYQANRIKEIVETHNVQHIGIDITGIGYGLFELVEQFYPRVTPINYSNDMKNQLIVKAIDVIENGRFEYQAGDKKITQAFMMISKSVTSGGQVTYASNRNNAVGHADIAWSIMHALIYEPINHKRNRTKVTFSH